MQDFLRVLFGDLSLGLFFGYMFLMLIGVVIHAATDVSRRNVESKNTPRKFSLKFFIFDNAKRFISVLLVIFICIRFSDKMFGSEPVDWMMIVLGYNIDSIMQFVKNKTRILDADREKLMQAHKE